MQRILIVTKYRFIGDSILAVPSIRAAANAWPRASISLLTGGKAHELLAHCPYIDEVIEFDPYRPSDQGLGRYYQLIRSLRRRRFDLALVLNRSFHSALISFLGGARMRVGWAGFQGRDFLFQKTCTYDHDRSEIECYLDIIRAASGLQADAIGDTSLALWLTKEERTLLPHPILERPKLIGMQPGATHDYKRWPSDRYAQLACELLAGGQASHIVLIGGPEETASAENMVRQCSPTAKAKITSLVGQLSLRQTLTALSCMDLFIANDTAIRHAAVALDVPSIALFGPTNPLKWGNLNLPLQAVVASASGEMGGISVDDVLESSTKLLQISRSCNSSASAVVV